MMNIRNLKIESITPPPTGGQSVSIVSSGIRIIHIPSGITASCEVERSQSKNKAIAIRMIEQGLADLGWKWVDDAG